MYYTKLFWFWKTALPHVSGWLFYFIFSLLTWAEPNLHNLCTCSTRGPLSFCNKKKKERRRKNHRIISSQFLPKAWEVSKLLTTVLPSEPSHMTATSCHSSCTVNVFKGKKERIALRTKCRGTMQPGGQEHSGAQHRGSDGHGPPSACSCASRTRVCHGEQQ